MQRVVVNDIASSKSLNSVGKVGDDTPRLDEGVWCAGV